MERSVDEHGKPVEKVILPDKEGLFAGGKLKDHHWSELESRIKDIERGYNSLKERKQRNETNKVDNNNDKKVIKMKDEINSSIKSLRNKVDNYIKKGDDDDYRWLDKINEHLPENVEETAFSNSIQMCLDYVESGK